MKISTSYIRKGKCSQCGECCRQLNDDLWGKNHICDNLKNNLCNINSNKPLECGEFPNSPWDLIYLKVKNKCGFWFEVTTNRLRIGVYMAQSLPS